MLRIGRLSDVELYVFVEFVSVVVSSVDLAKILQVFIN